MTPFATGDARAERIADLRALADFLDANPDAPLPKYGLDISLSLWDGTDEENVAEIARIASVFGVEPKRDKDGTHHRAVLKIGHLTYAASAVTEAGMDRHHAVLRLGEAALAEQEAAA